MVPRDNTVIHVRLLNEGSNVWRPVMAVMTGDSTWQIDEQQVPDDEVWEFQPGELVVAAERHSDGHSYLGAVQLKK